jgi:hypothetical protein
MRVYVGLSKHVSDAPCSKSYLARANSPRMGRTYARSDHMAVSHGFSLPSVTDYEPLLGAESVERILHKAHRLLDLHVVNVSSTYYGRHAALRPELPAIRKMNSRRENYENQIGPSSGIPLRARRGREQESIGIPSHL